MTNLVENASTKEPGVAWLNAVSIRCMNGARFSRWSPVGRDERVTTPSRNGEAHRLPRVKALATMILLSEPFGSKVPSASSDGAHAAGF